VTLNACVSFYLFVCRGRDIEEKRAGRAMRASPYLVWCGSAAQEMMISLEAVFVLICFHSDIMVGCS
jgi:hypothetical protein